MRGLTARTCSAPRPSLSSARLRLLRLSATKLTLSPLTSGGIARPMSPLGGSILTTSAPMSASRVPASGPAMKLASSITRIPASGFGIVQFSSRQQEALLDPDAGLVDDGLVHRHLLGDACLEHVGPLGHHRQAGLGKFFARFGTLQNGGELLHQPV